MSYASKTGWVRDEDGVKIEVELRNSLSVKMKVIYFLANIFIYILN